MNFGSFSGENIHHNQHSNEQLDPPHQICCPNCGTNFGEPKCVQDPLAQPCSLHLRAIIREEVEKGFDRVIMSKVLPLLQNSELPSISSSLPHQADEPSASRSWLLKFKGSLPDSLLTWTKIEEKNGSLEVELCDKFGKIVEVDDPESPVKIQIDVLDGDFDVDGTEEDYNRSIVKPRDSKGALLKGKSEIELSRGIANVGHLSFTDNSAAMRNKHFRLGARVVKGLPPGVVVRAAVSKEIRVKERRGGEKHENPSPTDDICNLVNIRKDGPVQKRAIEAGIYTVKDLLQLYHTHPTKMKDTLHVPEAKWKEIVRNAEACKLTNELYEYHDVTSGNVLLLDCAFNIISMTLRDQFNQPYYYKYDTLADFQKDQARELRRSAYEKRSQLKKIQISDQNLIYPSCIQGQEPPPSAPPHPSVGVVEGGLSESPNHVVANPIMCINSPTDTQYPGARAAYQVNLVENGTDYCMATCMINSSLDEHDEDNELWINELWVETPEQEEIRSNVISKVIAVCYVTKAAVRFKISVQQNPSTAPKKRPRLQ